MTQSTTLVHACDADVRLDDDAGTPDALWSASALGSISLRRANTGAERRMNMEIAAVLMLASVALGVFQLFDTAHF